MTKKSKYQIIEYKGKTLNIIQEAENYFLVSEYTEKFKIYSILKREILEYNNSKNDKNER